MKTIEISEETFEKIKDQLGGADIELNELDDMTGNNYFFRSVTYHLIGRVEKRIANFFQLSSASWVADSGRFMQAIKEGTLNEVEPVGTAYINIQSIVDFFPWRHNLPSKQK